ncbi:FAD-binding oxidoreductase [Nonomuraea sp. NN258]|uniref:FAD-binding oxidoreductase n=1 Tax=Nonomuraea antri TaxID=2730852 RepID=UPI001568E645|nr:FAD-binding oxidoreductase [Nonomuraea antri]NRQ40490.1 FAD-binding oxidoreductase [Nonomuraea antri]
MMNLLDGRLLLPGDPDYDEARKVWNASVDRRPRMIVQCASAADVATAIRAARENDLEIGVRCGGHGVLGLAVPDDGLMIDLTPMGGVTVDPAARRARVQGGALLGALDRAAQVHGLATTAGNVSHTGVGGLTLGGGMGWLARQYGLACDNVVSFEMVTAEGALVRASEKENQELYWGLRGGGGNFGVVTDFEFRLHPVGTRALVVERTYPAADALPVLTGWRELNAEAPRQATFTAAVTSGPSGPEATIGFVWVGGDLAAAHRLARRLGELGHPVRERVQEMSYVDLQRMDDSAEGHAYRRYFKGHLLGTFPDEAAAAFLTRGGDDELTPSVGLQAYGGAIGDVPDDATAYSQRGTLFEFVAGARWSDPAEDAGRLAAARRAAARLEPYAGGSYVNMLSDEGAEGVGRAYPAAKLARLTALKDAYDPANVFHLNANIRPSR